MANWEHFAVLKQGADVWNEWIEKHLEPDSAFRANLSGADLSDADLGGADLVHADLSEANLSGADLSDADLGGADLRRANLKDADLGGADLSDADLGDANLGGADLSVAGLVRADLSSANLTDADLSNADLRDADLGSANLAGADLIRADLRDASLIGANLNSASLVGANLDNTDLTNAELSRAKIGYTIFANTDLGAVQGLDSITHLGPSTIGIDTLFRSGGKIPEVFLRGCGVPDDLIRYARSLAGEAIDFNSCFISYSRQDQAFARRLHDGLQARGIRCWLDEKESHHGDDSYDEIEPGIRLGDKVLLCVSKNSLTSWWADDEIGRALNKEQRMMKESGEKVSALIPLNLDGYLLTGWKSLNAAQLKQRVAADFAGWETDNAKLERGFELLLKALRGQVGAP